MPIPGGVLVAGGAARCLYSATGMLRFLARLSGRRRHVRRSFGVAPGGATAGAVSLLSSEPSSSSSSSSSSSPPPPPSSSSLSSSSSSSSSSSLSSSSSSLSSSSSSSSSTPLSSCRFSTSTTTTSSNETVSKDPLTNQSFIDPIWANERNSDLDDIKLRQCYLRCRRNIQSTPRQELLNESSSCMRERFMEITATTTTGLSSSTITMQELEDDSLSRIAGLRDESTTITASRRQQRRYLEEIDDNDAEVSSIMSNKSSNISSNSNCCSSSSGSGKFWFSSTWLTNDENSGSTGVARYRRRRRIPSYLATLLFISYTLFGISEACSARSTPKPRPPTPTPRPNITFHMYTCPPDYAEWYCLNGATCFTVKIQESLLYNCLCANGFIGQRCEFKDLDGSYLPSRQRVMLETASIAGGATIAVFLVVIICIAAYIHFKRKQKEMRTSSTCVDTVDGPVRDPERRPFSNRNRPIMTFMAKNLNCNPGMCPSIEQTRMPGWNDYSQVELTRLASINEAKHSSQ